MKINFKAVLFFAFLFGACSYCAEYIAPLEFKGIVKDKYLSSSYKKTPVIVVDAGGQEIKFGPNGGDTLALYRHLRVGDSLIKKKGSYSFKVVRNMKSKYYTMDCNGH